MISLPSRQNQVLIDVDTQRDLFLAGGAASVYNHRRLLANIRRVMAAARHNLIPIISTAQVYPPASRNPGFCLAGTAGLKKLRYTIRENCVCYPTSDSMDLLPNLFYEYDQVVFCKRSQDPFQEPRLDRMLTELKVNELFLIGATAEGAVKATVVGLLARGKNVTVLTDVVGTRNRAAAARAFHIMEAKGATLTQVTDMIGCTALKTVHACQCKRCRTASP